MPPPDKLAERLTAVLAVVYLVFTEGYGALRGELCDEAIRLGRLVVELLPGEPEARALLALMLCTTRGATRASSLASWCCSRIRTARWDGARIAEGWRCSTPRSALAHTARIRCSPRSPACMRARRPTGHRSSPLRHGVQPTPLVELNRSVAIAMARGPTAGLAALERLRFALAEDHLYHAARADLLQRLGRRDDAARA